MPHLAIAYVLAGAAVALMFASLRRQYPLVVPCVAVAAVVSLPHVLAVLVRPTTATLPCAMALAYAAIIPWLLTGIQGVLAGVLFSTAWITWWFGFAPTWPRELLAVPEWHVVLAMIGAWRAWHFRRDDAYGLALLGMALTWGLLASGPARFVLLAPLAAVGAGRILYRGTLTKSWRIPPATWAMVLLAIAAIRSAVIVVTRAPQWENYQNRVADIVAKRSSNADR